MPFPPRKFSGTNSPKGPEVPFEQVAPILNEAKRLHDEVKELKDKVSELAEKNRRKSIELRDLVSPGEATTTTTTTDNNNFSGDFETILEELQKAQEILNSH